MAAAAFVVTAYRTERCQSVRLLWPCIGGGTVLWVCMQFGIAVSTFSCLGNTSVAGSRTVLKVVNEL
jgi:hypothetical protein